MMLILLLACSALQSDGSSAPDGVWQKVRPPPGQEAYECWVWAVWGNPFTDAVGGPECFPKVEGGGVTVAGTIQ